MTAQDIIREVQENAAEWIEMSKDPATLVAGILANKIIKLTDHIEYLEKRLNHVGSHSNY
jgi:hypothetical protein